MRRKWGFKKELLLFIVLIFVLVSTISLIGCTDIKVTKEGIKKEPKIKDFPYKITKLKPEDPEDPYSENIQMTFTNKSDYIVTGHSLEVELKGEKVLFLDDFTVFPGETSPVIRKKGPESFKKKDIKVLTYFVKFQDEKGNKKMLSYNAESGENKIIDKSYEEKQKQKEIKELFKIEDFPYELEILDADCKGRHYMGMSYTNKSNFTVTDYAVRLFLKDENRIIYASTDDIVLPGETSKEFTVFGSKSGKKRDIEVVEHRLKIKDENGDKYLVIYDARLDECTVYEDDL